MNYPQIAVGELLETHADRLFLYCWSMLRSRETAQIALRDTLLAAPADVTGSRLYALALLTWAAPANGGSGYRPPRHPRPSPSASSPAPPPPPTSAPASPPDTTTPDPSGS
jgi:hypothetical protein